MLILRVFAALAALGTASAPLVAQARVSRAEVVDAALRRGSRIALARADSAGAEARRVGARALPNPAVGASWTASYPTQHLSLELPLDLPWQRGPRVGAADAAAVAARARFAFERAATRYEAEVLYARALAAEAVAGLSQRTARDADSLLVLARLRRDAGDASDLDVELAAVNAGQLANASADDSLARLDALLEVQRVMGLSADSLSIGLADSLAAPGETVVAVSGATLPVLASMASLNAAERTLALERGSVFGVASLQLGVDHGDPGQPGVLPVVGFGLTLPLFDRRRGPIAQAASARDRASAELVQARRDSDADVARAVRERTAALARVRRDVSLLASAARVAQLALIAYREGAAALPSVLEAGRTARESQARHIADVAAAIVADASLRWLTATLETP